MAISLRLNEKIDRDLSRLAKNERISKSELVRRLIMNFLKNKSGKKTAWALGKDVFGLYGSGVSDLAVNRKKYLKEKLHAKQSRH